MYRRTHLAHLPAEQYLSLATLIVESAALHTAFAIACLVSYGMNNPNNQIRLGIAQAAQVQYPSCCFRNRIMAGSDR